MDTREVDRQTTIPERETAPNGVGTVATEQDPKPERTAPRKRIFFAIGGVIAIALLLIFGLPWLQYSLAHEGTDDARVDADAVAVTSRIGERIDRILVDTNHPVSKGQLLVIMDNKDEIARLRQAQAQYDLAAANQRALTTQSQGGVAQAQGEIGSQQAQVPVAQAGVDQAQAQLAVSTAQLPAAESAYVKAQADYARTQALVSTGDQPRQQLDAVRAQAAQAAATLRGAREQIGVAEAGVAASQQKVTASSATIAAAQGGLTTAQGKLDQAADPSQVESAKAQLDLARQSLGYTHINSPIDGYVGQKTAEVGQTVNAGMTLLTLIPHHIFITANFKETQMGSMRVGQPVDVRVDAYRGTTFHGRLESINPASQNTYALVPAQNATGNFVKVTQRIPVRISIENPPADKPLRPGMSVEAFVKIK